MQLNNNIPTKNENRWVAFLNGEPDISVASNQEAEENNDFTDAWEAAGNNFSYSAANPDKAWLNLQKKLVKSDRNLKITVFKSPVFKYAAMLVMALGIGFTAYQIIKTPGKQEEAPVMMAVVQTEAHPLNLSVITLPDGSTVKMNASTRIEYPVRFTGKIRKVRLSGEAFFEVSRDTAAPFIIETTNASVEVLGTSFNVTAYPKAGLVEVNVETGKVKLTKHSDGKSVLLPAGERGWLKVTSNEIGHAEKLASNYSSWITKKIIFQRTPLAEAFSVLENTYHVKIKTENSDIGSIPYTANFANLNLDYIVEVIARTHQLKVNRIGDEIVFSRIVN
jgi:transmembrane sensor